MRWSRVEKGKEGVGKRDEKMSGDIQQIRWSKVIVGESGIAKGGKRGQLLPPIISKVILEKILNS